MEAQPLDGDIIKEKEKITNMLTGTNTALEAAKYLNDQDYLNIQEARMAGDPEAALRAQENQIRVATTDKEIADLQQTIKKALESKN